MFATERQRARCCAALMDQSFLKGLWTEDGPTERAIALLESQGATISRGERVLLLVTWAIWSGAAELAVGEVFDLDGPKLIALGSLLVAMGEGSRAVEEWLETWEARSCSKQRAVRWPRASRAGSGLCAIPERVERVVDEPRGGFLPT
jgi:hypothetical protein